MTLLAVLYWTILVLAVIGLFVPLSTWPHPVLGSLPVIALLVIIGLKIFRTPLQ